MSKTLYTEIFQYMLLLRGATEPLAEQQKLGYFNTCSSCEEQRILLQTVPPEQQISIHAPLARSNGVGSF